MLSLILLSALLGSLQSQVETLPLDYVCPMDPDVRAALPGSCSRCGMKLIAGVIDPIEYGLDLNLRAVKKVYGEGMPLASVTWWAPADDNRSGGSNGGAS